MAKVVVNKITGDVIEEYNEKDLSLIPAFEAVSQFTPSTDVVEFSIYNEQGLLEYINPNYKGYIVTLNYSSQNNSVSTVTVDPEVDLIKEGYEQGNYTVYYNFLRDVVSSSPLTPYFLTQISSDRTEVRLAINSLTNEELQQAVTSFQEELDDSPYFEDFRLNFGNNNIFIATNILLDTSNDEQYTVLVKLYEPLPTQIELKDSLTIALQTADESSFQITFQDKIIPPPSPNKIGAPNFDLNLANKGNTDTAYKNASELLLGVSLTSSLDQIQNLLNQKGVKVNVDYSDFNNFVYFSSAEERVKNFFYKVELIQGYESEISDLDDATTSQVSSSIAILEKKKQEVIKNFDGYEYYQYYTSGSSVEGNIGNVYPKTSSNLPYELNLTTTTAAQTWITASIATASAYDVESVDRLANSLPLYVKEDTRNASFLLFMDMVGQHFDNIWLYTKDISNRFNGDNRLAYGISKDIVKDALVSMGVKVYGNNQSDFNIYSALTQINEDGTTGLPSGSGEINTTTIDIADPEPKEDIIKGVYKRIFHNLPYLLKKKGSYQGLRALINTFGVPGGMLKINEYGGWKNEPSTGYSYTTYEQTDNTSFTGGTVTTLATSPNSGFGGSQRNIMFRFKFLPNDLPSNETTYTIGTLGGTNLTLQYTGGGTTGDYDGQIVSSSLNLYKAELAIGSATVTAPFLNGEWWAVRLNAGDELRVGMNSHESGDGFEPAYIINGSGTETVGTGTTTLQGHGGSATAPANKFAFQELRMYAKQIGDDAFRDYVMNPYSLGVSQGGIISDIYDSLYFRAPLGSDGRVFENGESGTSVHPRQKGAYGDFQVDSFSGGSTYTFTDGAGGVAFSPNKEFIYFNEPGVGLKNRSNRGFKYKANSDIVTGDTLSSLTSIDQQNLDDASFDFPDVDYLEVGFSPQNEINNDIASSFSHRLDLSKIIGDPSQFQPNYDGRNDNNYKGLYTTASAYFEKYDEPYNWHDYARLIKFFDSSLMKMIKEFAPAKSNVATGVIIKQHLLERNKAIIPSGSIEDLTYSGSVSTTFKWDPNTDGTGSMTIPIHTPIGKVKAGAGGVFNAVNGLEYYVSGGRFLGDPGTPNDQYLENAFKPYPPSSITPTAFVSQSFQSAIYHKKGVTYQVNDTQQEFYNGELKGTKVKVTDGNLNPIAGVNFDGESNYPFRKYNGWNPSQGAGAEAKYGLFKFYNALSLMQAFHFNRSQNSDFIKDAIYFNTEVGQGITHIFLGRNSNPSIPDGHSADYNTIFGQMQSGDQFTMEFTQLGDPQYTGVPAGAQPINFPYTFTVASITQYDDYWWIELDTLSANSPQPGSYLLNVNIPNFQNTGTAFRQTNVKFQRVVQSATNQDLIREYDPQQNNVQTNRISATLMDVDYATDGSGSLNPVNLEQITTGSAKRAEVQDSNYSLSSWGDSRYYGVRNSSIGFNIPYLIN